MNLIFNEISFLPLTTNEYVLEEMFLAFIKTFKIAKEKYGFGHIVFPVNIGNINVTQEKTFYEWAYNIEHQGNKNTILSVVHRPFGEEILADQQDELSKYYYHNIDIPIPETYCIGLSIAFVQKNLCSSIVLHEVWAEPEIHFLKIINDDLDTESISVLNVTTAASFDDANIKHFIEYLGDVDLQETTIDPTEKTITLRDDHGKADLVTFSKKLRQSKYVQSIINSLPFNPKAVNLIKEIYSDGKVELVLYWDDRGIGIVVQTTGRNYRETEAIAKILAAEFDK